MLQVIPTKLLDPLTGEPTRLKHGDVICHSAKQGNWTFWVLRGGKRIQYDHPDTGIADIWKPPSQMYEPPAIVRKLVDHFAPKGSTYTGVKSAGEHTSWEVSVPS